MESENVKGKPLTKEETKCLLDLVEKSHIITTKTTNATNNKLKTEEWVRLAGRFNAQATSYPRTPMQLRLKWENLKKNARKRSTKIRMNRIKTGGGPAEYIPPDDILDRVTGLLGSTASGFTVPFGGDREAIECYGGGVGVSVNSSGDGTGDIRVSVVDLDMDPIPTPLSIDNDLGTVVTDYQVIDVIDQNLVTPSSSKKFLLNTPKMARKKFKSDDSRTARNVAIADYYCTKKQCLDAKLSNINLENENLKMKNLELKLKNDKLLLETQKLQLELEKLKKQEQI